MGEFFGISDLPVTIFTTPLEPVKIPSYLKLPRKITGEGYGRDVLIRQCKYGKRSFINRLINGFRKVI